MRRGARVFWQAVKDWYEEMMLLAGVSVVWWALTLLVVTGPPAAVGLHLLANRVVHGRRVSFSVFWEGFREHWKASWRVALLDLLLLVLLLLNVQFYAALENAWLRLLTFLWLYGLALWGVLQFYLFPLFLEQEDRRLWLIFRNAAVLVLARPLFGLTLLVLLAVISLVSFSTVLPLVVALPPFAALLANRATAALLEESAALAQREEPGRDEGQT